MVYSECPFKGLFRWVRVWGGMRQGGKSLGKHEIVPPDFGRVFVSFQKSSMVGPYLWDEACFAKTEWPRVK